MAKESTDGGQEEEGTPDYDGRIKGRDVRAVTVVVFQ
jgi:hypothetical protein